MKNLGRCVVAWISTVGTMALLLCVAATGFADTIKSEAELTTKDIDLKETVLGRLVADAIRATAKSDVAIIAASAFAEVTFPKGNVNSNDILKALEYRDDNVVIVKLTGSQINRALEHGLYLYPKGNSGFLQFSGMVVTINPDAEKEKRVISVKIGGDPLETSKTYKVAMPAPLANGALAYFKIWKKSDIDKDTNKTLETAITGYLSDHKTIGKGDGKGEERLVIKGKKSEAN